MEIFTSPTKTFRAVSFAAALLLSLLLPVIAQASNLINNTATLLIMGDSLSASYGIPRESGWVTLLENKLHKDQPHYRVINASISGETSGGSLTRLPALLSEHQPSIVIIEIGGNDGLRGYPIIKIRQNLQQLVALSTQAGAKVLITGIQIPPNYGKRYAQLFYASYAQTAQLFTTEKYRVVLLPFLLEGIATQRNLMQKDGIHPTAKAQPMILQNVWGYLKEIL
ncbi:MAG: acyl-CoA thioesterase-1 [Oceanicoccus sp.]|jgi:acyl-CoA thioesterase-1